MAVEIFRNARSLTDPGLEDAVLTAGVDASVTTFSVDATTFLPTWASGKQYRLLIDDELVIVTSVSSLDLTVTRAAEGTTGAVHALGAKLYHVLTAAALTNQSDVLGPSSSVDNAIVRFDGTTGKLIQGYTSNAPTVGDTGAVTIAPATSQNALTVTAGTQTTAVSPLTITETRNASGVTFPGIVYNVTTTAAAAGSLFFDCQLASSSKFSVRTSDGLLSSVGNVQTTGNLMSQQNLAVMNNDGGFANYNAAFGAGSSGVRMVGNWGLNWTSQSSGAVSVFAGSVDLTLGRAAAATLQLGVDLNGSAIAQTFKSCRGITGTDKTGAPLTIASGEGTGAGAVSSLIFQTPTVLASGTTQQSLATRLTISSAGLDIADATDIIVNATTGTKIGTATTQKLGFYNATPIVQGASVADPTGGAIIDAEARTALIALISRIEATGLIATV